MQTAVKTTPTPQDNLQTANRLVLDHIPIVRMLVKKTLFFCPVHREEDDLISAAMVGLVYASRRFDPSRGVLFKTFAERHIQGAIKDELRLNDRLTRASRVKATALAQVTLRLEKELGRPPASGEIATALGITLDEYFVLAEETTPPRVCGIDDIWENFDGDQETLAEQIPAFGAIDPLEQAMKKQLIFDLYRAVNTLPEKEGQAVSLCLRGRTLKSIGEKLGFTEGRVSQLISQAIIKLRVRLESHA